jgi:hypothetical protein
VGSGRVPETVELAVASPLMMEASVASALRAAGVTPPAAGGAVPFMTSGTTEEAIKAGAGAAGTSWRRRCEGVRRGESRASATEAATRVRKREVFIFMTFREREDREVREGLS